MVFFWKRNAVDHRYFAHRLKKFRNCCCKWIRELDRPSEVDDNVALGNYSGFQLVGGTFAAPSGATNCQIIFRAVNATGTLYGDDFDVRQTEPAQSFFNSASIAVIVYIASYYALKSRFATKVSKPSKVVTAGIGIYILAWLVVWTLMYTLVVGF